MKTVREIYRQLNNDNQIPEIDGEGSFTVEQMIWFGEQVVKLLSTPAAAVVRKTKESGAVCPKCGCNKITGDGSKNWCLNSQCDFVESD